jgi:tRNA A37 threonylcarbamoyladenosine biosynthesis protein TsaE
VAFVEWADRVAAVLPESWLELVLRILDDDTREVDVRPHGPAWTTRKEDLRTALERFA